MKKSKTTNNKYKKKPYMYPKDELKIDHSKSKYKKNKNIKKIKNIKNTKSSDNIENEITNVSKNLNSLNINENNFYNENKLDYNAEIYEKIKIEIEYDYNKILNKENKDKDKNILLIGDLDNNFINLKKDKTIHDYKNNKKKELCLTDKDYLNMLNNLDNNDYNKFNLEKLDVINKKFPLDTPIYDKIIYDNNEYIKDIYQYNKKADYINYRCKNFRKNQYKTNNYYCYSMVKRLSKENFIYYKLTKNHSSQYKALKKDELTIENDHIKNYEDFVNECFDHLDKIEIFKK